MKTWITIGLIVGIIYYLVTETHHFDHYLVKIHHYQQSVVNKIKGSTGTKMEKANESSNQLLNSMANRLSQQGKQPLSEFMTSTMSTEHFVCNDCDS